MLDEFDPPYTPGALRGPLPSLPRVEGVVRFRLRVTGADGLRDHRASLRFTTRAGAHRRAVRETEAGKKVIVQQYSMDRWIDVTHSFPLV